MWEGRGRGGWGGRGRIVMGSGELQKGGDCLEANRSRFSEEAEGLYLLGSLNQELKSDPRAIL
ncbi:hypothetical protein IQA79_17070 [Leptospira borgpetersenii serovar Ballum]|nr:hypothetical protein [Leptospira borgpetersenii serovar Ballum]